MSENNDLITSLPLIRRYSRHNEAENARFADFVKFKLNLSNQELDQTVQETADSVFDKINCLDCGNCCHSPQIEVDEKDAQRIANRIGISLKEFKSKYLVKINKVQQFKSAPCPFLGEDNACKVYEDRPSACRAFPYLHEGNFRSRVYVTLENVAACPIAFNVWQELKTKLGEKSKK